MRADSTGAKRILIRGTNWVGDAVICIPAIREIRRIFPEARISLMVRPWVREIYAAAEFVDEILEYDKQEVHHGLRGFCRLVAELKSRRFDLAILLQNAFEAAFLAWCARIPRRVGYARDGRGLLLTNNCRIDPEVRRVHQVYYYLDMLSQMGWLQPRMWDHSEYSPDIAIGVRDSDARTASQLLISCGIGEQDKIIGLNPGAFYGPAKRWFPDRYAAVADRLAARYNAKVVIFGSSSDLPVVKEVSAKMTKAPVILAGRTTLGELMGLLKRCRLLITNDSGPMHLAAALDIPQLAIFGSTSEIATGPLSRKAVVIKKQADCNPCFLRECPTDFRCMKEISIEYVFEEARRILDLETAAGYE